MKYNICGLTALLLLLSCSSIERYDQVSIDEYRDIRKCWYRHGHNEALLITAENGRELIPYLISTLCNVHVDGYPARSGFLAMLKAIPLTGDQGELQKLGYVDRPLSSNSYAHIPIPTGDRFLYKIKFDLVPRSAKGAPYFSIGKVFSFCRTDVSLNKYEMMSDRDRAGLADNVDCIPVPGH